MKYENFEEVSKICKELDRLTELRRKLTDYPIVDISTNQGRHIMQMGCGASFEHEYSGLAQGFVIKIIGQIDLRIEELKNDLSTL